MDILVAVRTVHGAAAACDHLAGRDAVDRVVGLGVAPEGDATATRDAGEALNVLAVRLPGVGVDTQQRVGEAADVLSDAVADHDADEVVVAEEFDGHEVLWDAVGVPVTVVDDPAAAG